MFTRSTLTCDGTTGQRLHRMGACWLPVDDALEYAAEAAQHRMEVHRLQLALGPDPGAATSSPTRSMQAAGTGDANE